MIYSYTVIHWYLIFTDPGVSWKLVGQHINRSPCNIHEGGTKVIVLAGEMEQNKESGNYDAPLQGRSTLSLSP